MVSVLVACGEASVGAEIVQRVSVCPDVEVLGLVSTEEAVMHQVAAQKPDLLVFHVPTCGCPKEQVFRKLRQIAPSLRILAVGCRPPEVGEYFLHLAPWGLSGCVCEGEGPELQEAIRVLGAGGTLYLCPQASQAIVEAYRHRISRWNREQS